MEAYPGIEIASRQQHHTEHRDLLLAAGADEAARTSKLRGLVSCRFVRLDLHEAGTGGRLDLKTMDDASTRVLLQALLAFSAEPHEGRART